MLFLDIISLIRELCLYFSSFGYLAGGGSDPAGALVLFLLAAVSGILAMLLYGKGNLRWLAILPVLGMFILPAGRAYPVMVLPVIAYIAVRIKNETGGAGYSSVKTLLVRGTVLAGGMAFVILLFVSELLTSLKETALPFLAAFFLLSIYEMRMRRNSGSPVSKSREYALLNLVPVVLITLIGIAALSKTVQSLAVACLKFVYAYAVLPPLYLFIRFMLALFWLLRYPFFWLMKMFGGTVDMEEALSDFGEIDDSLFFEPTEGAAGNWTTLVIRTIILIIFILICYYVLRQLSRRRQISYSGGDYTRQQLPRGKKENRVMSFLFRHPDPVREAYRQYLRLCGRADIPADGRLASDQIMKQTEMYLHTDDAAKLRDLWLPVRYGEKKSGDGQAAKELIRKLRKEFRLRGSGE